MRITQLLLAAALSMLVAALAATAKADSTGRIYGKLTTTDGDVFEGLIRWDTNEGSWVDILNGNKDLPRSRSRDRRKYRDRGTEIRILGINIGSYRSLGSDPGSAQSGLCFGHIASIEMIDDDAARIILKSGEEIELEGGSTDIGESIRGIVIEDRTEGEIEFEWDDVERIEFMQGDAGLVSSFGDRLFGTLTTRRGDTFTGWVCWDVDELFTEDIIDGNEKQRKRKIEFAKIAAIERHSSNAATLHLRNGDEMTLRGTNDVDEDNRGIAVFVDGLGQVTAGWDEFKRLDFTPPPYEVAYDQFDGGRRLRGTVYAEGGDTYTGYIRWDDDEEYGWELLDGEFRDLDFDVEFRHIRAIERRGSHSSLITLRDGTTLRLGDSNDVDEDNKGIFITLDDGDEIELDWDEFERVEFAE